MGHDNQSLLLDAIIMVSNNFTNGFHKFYILIEQIQVNIYRLVVIHS